MRRLRKRITILVVFLVILLAIGLGIYLIIRPEQPTCFDGIQNQGETGIDCGGPCGACPHPKELEIVSHDFILTTSDNFDLVAEVKNPNADWGVESMVYEFTFYNANNQLIGSKQGTTYILPQETKYIVEQKIYPTQTPSIMKFDLKDISWQKLTGFSELQIRVKNETPRIIDGKYNLYGAIENKSNYNLDRVEVVGLLFDENHKIIAVGKTEIRTFLMGETRDFEINWPYADKEISSSEIKVYTNIFLDETFIKSHGTQEKFKEY
ncbi:MAG: hypothetical protein COU82_00040 [Candidatus Portnoybacteria bacterium CG10_big_fil_rev_8_21_14_0_10_38_18]|uniref:Uncharacterized protein n=1 Tax=Candidatus Portnoybacteria bacterium CG10_big_fil_rev_8_21_14_0_10_38_18 TaxID=1974813 RepID=A0A2M8KCX3_9BACT|nr:MAG: hypothetical protein COU82_00040 [Candidatus Portnoybacteria bacterium CG10_big_fil_rev_8_21_14_0_10_38_18]